MHVVSVAIMYLVGGLDIERPRNREVGLGVGSVIVLSVLPFLVHGLQRCGYFLLQGLTLVLLMLQSLCIARLFSCRGLRAILRGIRLRARRGRLLAIGLASGLLGCSDLHEGVLAWMLIREPISVLWLVVIVVIIIVIRRICISACAPASAASGAAVRPESVQSTRPGNGGAPSRSGIEVVAKTGELVLLRCLVSRKPLSNSKSHISAVL